MLSLLLIACSPTSGIPDPCQPDPPVAGEVRARRIVCTDELMDGAEARVGDWMLENSRVRIAIRDATNSLTQLDGTGATILDLAVDESRDVLTEIIPRIDGAWLEDATVTAHATENEGRIRVSGVMADGTAAAIEYRLGADETLVSIDEASGWIMVPRIGTELFGDALEVRDSGVTTLLATHGTIDDRGGWLDGSAADPILVGPRDDVHALLWPDGRQIEGSSDGEWVWIETAEGLAGRLPVVDGVFSGWVPTVSMLTAVADGHALGTATVATDGLDLRVGPAGFLELVVVDQDGEPIPAHLESNRGGFDLVQEVNTVPVGPGPLTGSITAGPAYGQHELESIEVEGTVERLVILERAITPAALVEIGVTAFPDPTDRRRTSDVTAELLGRGVHYAVLAATDEVVQVSSDDDTADMSIAIDRGSRSGDGISGAVTWPWSTKRYAPAHGATPWADLDARDLLAVMTKRGRRFSVVDAQWAHGFSDPIRWDPRPDMVRLVSTDDSLDSYTALLDAWLPVSAVGPLTWVETESRVRTDILRGLVAGQSIASTGPRIVLRIDGQGPGADLSRLPDTLDRAHHITLRVEAPTRMDIDWVMLLGSGQTQLAAWSLLTNKSTTRLDTELSLSTQSAWVIAVAGGDDTFAVTSPVWLKRP